MTRLLYLSRINLVSNRTNVYNLAKTCEAVNATEGFRVTLVTTNRSSDVGVFFKTVGVRKPFDVICLGATDSASAHSGKSWYEFFMFLAANLRLAAFLLMRAGTFDAVYFRDESLLPAALWAKAIVRKGVFFEIHSVLERRSRQMLNISSIRLADGVVAISTGLKRYYQKRNPNILVSLCSASEDMWFDHTKDKHTFRKELGLPEEPFLIGYAGVIGANPNNDYYEVDDVVRSLALLPAEVWCVVVGEVQGNAQWLRSVARESGVEGRMITVPWRERSEIPKYLQTFDAILIPKRKKDLVGDSPAKMFTALTARRPIVAGRAESIEEVLTDGKDALLVRQNNPQGWAEAILKLYEDKNLGERLAAGAVATKGRYTWGGRGAAIAEFIRKTMRKA